MAFARAIDNAQKNHRRILPGHPDRYLLVVFILF
jgi:hypothetical protein